MIGKFDPDKGLFWTWSLIVVCNVCRDRLRRRGLEWCIFIADGELVIEWVPVDVSSLERVVLACIEIDRLNEVLEILSEKMRLAVVLYHSHGSTYEEIANILEVLMGTVMTWLHCGWKCLWVVLSDVDELSVVWKKKSVS